MRHRFRTRPPPACQCAGPRAELRDRHEDGHRLHHPSCGGWAPGCGCAAARCSGGGIGPRAWILNAQVPGGYPRLDPDRHLAEIAAAEGLSGPGAGLMTAAEVAAYTTGRDGGVTATVTTGLGVRGWAAAPEPRPRAPGLPVPSPGVRGRRNRDPLAAAPGGGRGLRGRGFGGRRPAPYAEARGHGRGDTAVAAGRVRGDLGGGHQPGTRAAEPFGGGDLREMAVRVEAGIAAGTWALRIQARGPMPPPSTALLHTRTPGPRHTRWWRRWPSSCRSRSSARGPAHWAGRWTRTESMAHPWWLGGTGSGPSSRGRRAPPIICGARTHSPDWPNRVTGRRAPPYGASRVPGASGGPSAGWPGGCTVQPGEARWKPDVPHLVEPPTGRAQRGGFGYGSR